MEIDGELADFIRIIFGDLLPKKKPEPPKVRAICRHCGAFHDGSYRFCECCIFGIAPDWEVEQEVTNRVDQIEYEIL